MKKAKGNLLFKNINFFNKYLLITISILIVITSGITSYAAFSLQLSGNQTISIKVKDYKLPDVTTVSTSKTGTIINPKVTIRATVTDNVGIVGYQVTESNITPTSNWTTITSTTSTTISKDVSVAKTYYFWVKDQAGNISITKSLVVTASDLDYFSDCFAYTQTTTEVTITDYKCYAGNTYGYPTITDVTIPTKLNNKNVINIGSSAFSTNGLTKVTLPTTLKTIGSYAFENNKLTGTLLIPTSVTTIGHFAFCSDDKTSYNKLTGLTFQSGSNLTSIGGFAFRYNSISTLSTFSYLTKLQTIDIGAFRDNNLTGTLVIPASVTTIASSAFASLDKTSYNKLTGLTFQSGSNLTSIGVDAFSNNNIASLSTFNNLTKLQTIDHFAFANNNLTGTLVIPASVTSIGNYAFSSINNGLTGLTFQSGSSLTSIGRGTFQRNSINSLSTFNYLTKLQTIGESAFHDNNLAGTLVIPATVTTIGRYAFASSTKNADNQLTGLTFQSGSILTSIADHAFFLNNISSLSTFNYLTKLQTIGPSSFENNNLTGTLVIPATVTTIGGWSFSSSNLTSYNKLTGLTFQSGSNLTSIGSSAFLNNNIGSLSTFNYLTKLQTVGYSAFENNNITGSIVIPTGVTTIELAIFAINQLTSVTIPNSVTVIGPSAFQDNKLTSITIPNSVTLIESHSFHNNLLTSVTIGTGVKTIEYSAFENNNITGTLTIPASVTTIETHAFWKSSTSNSKLVTIRNLSGRSFGWTDITGGNSFANGIITHNNGNISVIT